jgi:2'-5' RNA ligase
MNRSALVLLVPEADALVGRLRLAHDPSARAGMAAHVTLLFPFLPAARLEDHVVAHLREQFQGARDISGAAELRFDRVARFPGVSYLALSDAEVVATKIRALAAAWPECPPYEGRFADVVPHLTVACGDDDLLDAVEAELAPSLPLVAHARTALLAVEDAAGRWREHAAFNLVNWPDATVGAGGPPPRREPRGS